MIHEPECSTKQGEYRKACECPALRAAYKRGRYDAAKAVWVLSRGYLDEAQNIFDEAKDRAQFGVTELYGESEQLDGEPA